MDDNQLDQIIENGIKNASMETEVRTPVMARIEEYEITKAKRPGVLGIIIYIYVLLASLVSIVFFDRVSVHYRPALEQLPFDFSVLKSALQGVFLFMLVYLVILALYSRSIGGGTPEEGRT